VSAFSLFLEMLVIFILISAGYIFYRRGVLDDRVAKGISFLVVNLCNPALLLNAAINNQGRLSPSVFLTAFAAAAAVYAILIACAYLIPFLLGIPRSRRYSFKMLTIFGNIGFIGFPVCSAVLGEKSLVYVTVNCLVFNLLFYTYGIATLEGAKTADNANAALPARKNSLGTTLRSLLNAGTVSAVVTILVYLLDPPVPTVIAQVISYLGNATIFLSMVVLGCSVASIPFRQLLGDRRMYVFLGLRMLVLPILLVLLLKRFLSDPLLLGTMAVMVSLPGGNLPLMYSRECGLDDRDLSRGIILSTVICIITIPVVCLFL
jgi:predicted permease